MIILSLDVSTASTGYCIYDTEKKSKKAKIRDFGVITMPISRDFSEKKYNFNIEIERLIIKYRPDIVIREEFITNVRGMSNKRAIISMGSFHKDLELICWKFNLELIDIKISDIKLVLGLTSNIKIERKLPKAEKIRLKKLKREEKKRNTIKEVNSIFGLSLDYDTKGDEDIADSVSCVQVYLKFMKESE